MNPSVHKIGVVRLNPVNLLEAVELLEIVSNFDFKGSEKKPQFCIYDSQKEGYNLRIKANMVSEEYRSYLKEIVNSHELGMRESEGYLIIHGH